ncbi:hypothetical protein M3Y98_00652200 [Aphelenchoides besseyi]|nr:hypothetical protein M3Y98_00652200 [Aphelenchoides besseyi]
MIQTMVNSTLNFTHHDDSVWQTILKYEPAFELILCAPCLFINIYFALRFSKLSTFNSNLKIVMISTNITTAFIALLRPLLRGISERSYSVKDGHYIKAAFVYLLFYLVQVFTLIMDAKYLLVGLERYVAFRDRADYERRDTKQTVRLLICFIAFIAVSNLIKNSMTVVFTDQVDWDRALEHAFITERSPVSFVFLHVIAGIGWLVGAITFYRLKVETKKNRYMGKSLSESYQIREIAKVVDVLGALIVAYLSTLIFCLICLGVLCHHVYFDGGHVKSALFLALSNAEYISLNIYNIFATIYMLWKFNKLREVLFQDLCCLFRIKMPTAVEAVNVDREVDLDDHFRKLTAAWNRAIAVKQQAIVSMNS